MSNAKFDKWLRPENCIRIEGWARDGLVDEQIAANMGVSRASLLNWKKRFPLIADALCKGKDSADREVENALFKSATGFTYTEVTEEQSAAGESKSRTTVKYVAPSPVAAMFWLQNRKPEVWRDVRRLDLAGQIDTALKIVIDDGEGESTDGD